MTPTLLAASRDSDDVLFLLGVIVVIGSLIAAGYCAYIHNFIGAGILLVVAVVAAFLLL
jgi:hypothetical protein